MRYAEDNVTECWAVRLDNLIRQSAQLGAKVFSTDASCRIFFVQSNDATSAFREITIRAFGPSALAPLSLVRSQVVLVIE